MLSDAEIIRRLRTIRHSPSRERYARRAPSINGIAKAAGISREYLFRLLKGEPIGSPAREKLSLVLTSERMNGGKTAVLCPTEHLPAVSKSSHYS
jgi:hypothetical protein